MSTHELIFLNYLSTVFENLEDSIILCEATEEGPRPMLVNQGFYTITGYPKMSLEQFQVELKNSTMCKEFLPYIQKALKQRDIESTTFSIIFPSGEKNLRARFIPVLNSLGEPTHIVAIARDISNEHAKDQRIAELEKNLK